LTLGILNVIVNSLTIAFLLHWIWEQQYWLGILQYVKSPWLGICISFLVLDFYLYVWHRLMHNIPLGWRFHQVHHTELSMNTSTAYRFHTVEVILSNFPKLLLVWIFGINPTYLLFFEVLLAIELIFHHSNWAIPGKLDKYLSYLIVTPNIHRLHHSQLLQDSKSNYASFLTIWDRIFDSYSYPKYPEKIKLGLPQYNKSLSILKLLWLPLQKH
jgi:sterol desaturase/sphingolipid hydroxylase (fatty acid hydroxylase superfamily)